MDLGGACARQQVRRAHAVDMICVKCGAHFRGTSRDTHCPACRKSASRTLFTRTCKQCGSTYQTYGPRSSYCPACAAERQRAASREAKRRASAGTGRQLGSTDICQLCGGEYIVSSGRQRYCPACAAKKLKEDDRARALDRYYSGGKERRDELTASSIKAPPKIAICAVCGRPFAVDGPRTKTCSPECTAAYSKMLCAAWEKSHKPQRSEYRKKLRKSKEENP